MSVNDGDCMCYVVELEFIFLRIEKLLNSFEVWE